MRQPTRAGQAAVLAARLVQQIQEAGQDVTLPDASVLRAVKDDDQYKITRYVSTEGEGPSLKSPILLQFAGAVADAGTLEGRPLLTVDGLNYRIYSLHPQKYQGVCVELVAVASKP